MPTPGVCSLDLRQIYHLHRQYLSNKVGGDTSCPVGGISILEEVWGGKPVLFTVESYSGKKSV